MFSQHSRLSLLKYMKSNLKISSKFKSSMENYQEVRIPVPWGHIAGKWWGPTNRRPILTLHGWQDNCGSFNRFIPLLNADVGFLAIDFPGHGYSSRLPSGLYYHFFTDYVIVVQYIMHYFNWPKISFLGHSLGALISSEYCLLYPKNVDFLICIDGVKIGIKKFDVINAVKDFKRFPELARFEMDHKEPPSYSMEDIKQRVSKATNNSIWYENSHHVIERNIAPSIINPGKYYFSRDPRLKMTAILKWPDEIAEEFAKYVTCPIFYVKSTNKGGYDAAKKSFHQMIESFKKTSIDYQFHEIEGSHHLHLNNPEKLADLINTFIEKHVVPGRDGGGMKEEMKRFKANL